MGICDRVWWIYCKYLVIVYNYIFLNFDVCIIVDDVEERKNRD